MNNWYHTYLEARAKFPNEDIGSGMLKNWKELFKQDLDIWDKMKRIYNGSMG